MKLILRSLLGQIYCKTALTPIKSQWPGLEQSTGRELRMHCFTGGAQKDFCDSGLSEISKWSQTILSAESWVNSDADPCIKQVPNASHIVSDCLVINWVECYGKEQGVLWANIRVQTGKAYLPICCLWHSLVTLAFRRRQTGARTGRKWKLQKRKERKVFFLDNHIMCCWWLLHQTNIYLCSPSSYSTRTWGGQVYGYFRVTFLPLLLVINNSESKSNLTITYYEIKNTC